MNIISCSYSQSPLHLMTDMHKVEQIRSHMLSLGAVLERKGICVLCLRNVYVWHVWPYVSPFAVFPHDSSPWHTHKHILCLRYAYNCAHDTNLYLLFGPLGNTLPPTELPLRLSACVLVRGGKYVNVTGRVRVTTFKIIQHNKQDNNKTFSEITQELHQQLSDTKSTKTKIYQPYQGKIYCRAAVIDRFTLRRCTC